MLFLTSHPALLVIDMQNGFVHPAGTFGQLSLPVSAHLAVIAAIQQLIAAFDARNLPVFFTRLAWKADYSDCGRLLDKFPAIKELHGFQQGSWDADVVDELKPAAQHVIVDKTRNSAFWKTDLESKLRERAAEQVVVVGVGWVDEATSHQRLITKKLTHTIGRMFVSSLLSGTHSRMTSTRWWFRMPLRR